MGEMSTYAIDLRSMTQSRGTFTLHFVRYEDCPPAAQEKAIAEAKARHRPVIAVGTTSVRTLEGVAQVCGRAQPFAGWTDIFLYPGRPFRVVDGIITNFHLPESSLLMLVSAFAGRKRILEAYQEAVKEGYRFFSYGDAMLIR